jgi:mRNA-degrading endonuclease RelE of RelBE toxin-antitoxin system
MIFENLTEFDKDIKKLSKSYKTLITDIEVVKKVLKIRPNANEPFSFRISNLGIEHCIIKVRKIASDSFKTKGVNSGFRLIYAYFEIEQKIILIELYHKSQKENEDKNRILNYFKN